MLLRNINPPKLFNGTRLHISCLKPNIIQATIITDKFWGESVIIPRIPLFTTDQSPVKFRRLQFPVKICFAVKINKSQGQTLNMAGIDLRQKCFSHGQFYVACSRVSKPENLILFIKQQITKNIVYPEVL